MITDAQIAQRAAEILARDGWCQGTGLDAMGRRCIMGAGRTAVREMIPPPVTAVSIQMVHWRFETDDRVDAWGHALSRVLRMWVPKWNDQPGRTAGEAIRALQEFAAQNTVQPEPVKVACSA